jgi:hypothetical protein
MKDKAHVVRVRSTVEGRTEEWDKVLPNLEEALKFINEKADPVHATNAFQLFKLGTEVPLQFVKRRKVIDLGPETTTYSVKEPL